MIKSEVGTKSITNTIMKLGFLLSSSETKNLRYTRGTAKKNSANLLPKKTKFCLWNFEFCAQLDLQDFLNSKSKNLALRNGRGVVCTY